MSSAIDNTFHFVRNPTAINGLPTTYGSKRGSDVSGDGTAQNPYASIAKITSVTTAGNNIMLDDSVWSQQRTLNGRAFKWWGNGRTEIDDSITNFSIYSVPSQIIVHTQSWFAEPLEKSNSDGL